MSTQGISLKPGTYRLTEAVSNPKPDRRERHDWRKEAEWAEGRLFFVDTVHIPGYPDVNATQLNSGRWTHQSVYERDEVYQLLAPRLQFAGTATERYSDFAAMRDLMERLELLVSAAEAGSPPAAADVLAARELLTNLRLQNC